MFGERGKCAQTLGWMVPPNVNNAVDSGLDIDDSKTTNMVIKDSSAQKS